MKAFPLLYFFYTLSFLQELWLQKAELMQVLLSAFRVDTGLIVAAKGKGHEGWTLFRIIVIAFHLPTPFLCGEAFFLLSSVERLSRRWISRMNGSGWIHPTNGNPNPMSSDLSE